jgi:hypothetical protein
MPKINTGQITTELDGIVAASWGECKHTGWRFFGMLALESEPANQRL